MFAQQRRVRILRFLEEHSSAKVRQLSALLKVSSVTVRKDLAELETQGLIVTEHGGAYLSSNQQPSLNGAAENLSAKRKIAAAAANFVENGDTLILHSGTTVAEFAKQIVSRRNLTAITTSIDVAHLLAAHRHIRLHVTGGELIPGTDGLSGPQAAQFFEGVFVDKLFMSAVGLSPQTGVGYSGTSELAVQKAMIKSARRVFLMLDSSKIGKQALASLGDVSLVHVVITDDGISAEHRRWLAEKKIELSIAG